jgi:hypothetical protein
MACYSEISRYNLVTDYMFDIQVGQYIFLYDSEGRISHITFERRNINLKYV